MPAHLSVIATAGAITNTIAGFSPSLVSLEYATRPKFPDSRTTSRIQVVTLTFASWNQFNSWQRQIEAFRKTA